MNTNLLKRWSAVLLSVMVFFSFTAASALNVNAASKKTFYVVSSISVSNTYTNTYDGKTTTDKDSFKITPIYNKNGLETGAKNSDGKTTYSHNKKGYITGYKSYDKKGKLTKSAVYKLDSKGRYKTRKYYTYSSGKKTLDSTETYTYYSNGNTKTCTSKNPDGTVYKSTYDKYGNEKTWSYSYKNDSDKTTYKNTLDKKHNPTKVVATTVRIEDGEKYTTKETTTHKYTYNKKGSIVKDKYAITSGDGYTEKGTWTYTYNKQGKTTKMVLTSTSKYDNTTSKTKNVTTYKWKKVSVPKKYWKLFQ